jgi:hypothetical protein
MKIDAIPDHLVVARCGEIDEVYCTIRRGNRASYSRIG